MVSETFNNAFEIILFLTVVLSSSLTVFLYTLPSSFDPWAPDDVQLPTEKRDTDSEDKDGKPKPVKGSTQVVVLGDIGRSPRMQYHAISIAKHGMRVHLIGYQESEIHPDVISNPLINVVAIAPIPPRLRTSSKLLFPVIAPLKAVWQALSLYQALGYRTEPAKWMLVQNPPSIPTLAIARGVCFFRNTRLIIDWHNFGYSILALKLGPRHPLVAVASLYERFFSRSATEHFAVTNAMVRVLKEKYGVKARALHDRPASLFRPLNPQERKRFLSRLPDTAQYADDLTQGAKSPWCLLVSSTSWTADEDFSVLLDALCEYSALAVSKPHLPKILAIITGKGPLKEHYLARLHALNQEKRLSNVIVRTAWLTPEDYAMLLGAADLGVSLHTSSSGVDLPMKVVDMFGAGLPVVGWSKFEAWPELVKEGVNGQGFGDSQTLAKLLVDLFEGKDEKLSSLKKGALRESEYRWDDEWDEVAGKLLKLVR